MKPLYYGAYFHVYVNLLSNWPTFLSAFMCTLSVAQTWGQGKMEKYFLAYLHVDLAGGITIQYNSFINLNSLPKLVCFHYWCKLVCFYVHYSPIIIQYALWEQITFSVEEYMEMHFLHHQCTRTTNAAPGYTLFYLELRSFIREKRRRIS